MKSLVISFLLIPFLTFGILLSQEKTQEKPKETQKPEESSRNLVIVEEVKPVPQNVKTGFESIDGEDGLAYLKFLSSIFDNLSPFRYSSIISVVAAFP